jgi:hypothetical protein
MRGATGIARSASAQPFGGNTWGVAPVVRRWQVLKRSTGPRSQRNALPSVPKRLDELDRNTKAVCDAAMAIVREVLQAAGYPSARARAMAQKARKSNDATG